jgi:hypothetical protein
VEGEAVAKAAEVVAEAAEAAEAVAEVVWFIDCQRSAKDH